MFAIRRVFTSLKNVRAYFCLQCSLQLFQPTFCTCTIDVNYVNNIPLKCWYALLIKLLFDILLNHNDLSIAPGGVPLSFAPASSEVVNPVGSLHHPGPLHHLEQAGGPGAPPASTLSATYLNLNSHLLALDILRSLFCLSGRRRDGSPLPQLPTGWLYEHRQAPGDLCLFLTSRRRMFKFNFQKVEFDPASSLYIGQVSLWDQIECGRSFFSSAEIDHS